MILWVFVSAGAIKQYRGYFFSWDAFGYHLYLPAILVHQDPFLTDMAWVDAAQERYRPSDKLYQITQFNDGSRISRYPLGLAMLWSPWFVAGHVAALSADHPADGYSAPYQLAVLFGVLVYFLVGLLMLRAVLRAHFGDHITLLVLVLLVLGTNLLDQTINATNMPHVVLFAIYSGIVFFTQRWVDDRRPVNAVPLALLMGLAMLVRPTEVVCVLLPFLWRKEGEPLNPWTRLKQYRKQWGLIVAVMFVVGMIQFNYWKGATGRWFVDPYNNPGEGLDLLSPHLGPFLFSFRKGWLLYTPLMLAAILGLFALKKGWKDAWIPVSVFFLANLYLVSSWTNWWYAGSFGSRAMVGSYAVMALPLAAMIHWVADRSRALRWSISSFLVLAVVLNLFQHWQYVQGIIDQSRMTREAYLAVFGRTTVPERYGDMLLIDRTAEPAQHPPDPLKYGRIEPAGSLVRREPSPRDTLVSFGEQGGERTVYRMGDGNEFSPAVRLPYCKMTDADHLWVEARWHVFSNAVPVKGSFVCLVEHGGKSYGYNSFALEERQLEPGRWNTFTTYYLTPEIRNTDDLFLSYYWSRDDVPVLVDGPYFTLWEPVERN